mmetsp:Transcript_23251/g.34118  ORF Transcript_23251/g.34118 Transcript_23251/m.34118 type:complete len:178 (+) Transcript_23251:447-980(+)
MASTNAGTFKVCQFPIRFILEPTTQTHTHTHGHTRRSLARSSFLPGMPVLQGDGCTRVHCNTRTGTGAGTGMRTRTHASTRTRTLTRTRTHTCTRMHTHLKQIELPAELLDYSLWSSTTPFPVTKAASPVLRHPHRSLIPERLLAEKFHQAQKFHQAHPLSHFLVFHFLFCCSPPSA